MLEMKLHHPRFFKQNSNYKTLLSRGIHCLTLFYLISLQGQELPYLENNQLMVDQSPFMILGGELGNSTASTPHALSTVWSKANEMHLNTILAPVYWELIEPEETKFDFSSVEYLLKKSKENHLKLVLLWFGTWKNSMSSYVPHWIKKDVKRFPRAKDENNISQEILSPFSEEVLQADLDAFKALMGYIKKADPWGETVIMIQVENEIGMLPSARDHQTLAEQAFQEEVPKKLIDYLKKNKKQLQQGLLERWKTQGYPTQGNWEAVFGKGVETDEFFMAWHFSVFANQIAEAGKKIHNLPMFVNAALNHRAGKKPGEYPSGGPLPHLMDIWKAAGSILDFYSPDYYTPNFKHWSDLYHQDNNPLFVPEHRFDETVGAKALYAMGHYNALGFSPFSIENSNPALEKGLKQTYALLENSFPVLKQEGENFEKDAVLIAKGDSVQTLDFEDYTFHIKHGYTLSWTEGQNLENWPLAASIVVQVGSNEFYVIGTGAVMTVESKKNLSVGLLEVEEGIFADGKWQVLRYLNGDQTHQGRHISIPVNEYQIQRVSLYTYP